MATVWEEGGKLGHCFTLMPNLDGTNRRGGGGTDEMICCRGYSPLHLTGATAHKGKRRWKMKGDEDPISGNSIQT